MLLAGDFLPCFCLFATSLRALKSEIGSSHECGNFGTHSLIITPLPGFALNIHFTALLTTEARDLICFQATFKVILNISLNLMTQKTCLLSVKNMAIEQNHISLYFLNKNTLSPC